MIPANFSPLGDHLWQSTLFTGIAGLLTLVLRNNGARVRHWVWLAASCKFLIPFSVLISLGAHLQWQTTPRTTQSTLIRVMDEVSQPFTGPAVSPAPAALPAASPVVVVLWTLWACGSAGIGWSWWSRWRRIHASARAGRPVELELPIRAVSSPTLLEPGVFGVFRPILLLPEGILDRLTAAQLKSVIAHELCHTCHRDNLIAAIHMFVETVFWFHPLVWWIGRRMAEERERACDEEVLRLGSEPRVYAEGILNVCKGYVESPLVCVSGIAGANLKRRIEAIMGNRRIQGLDRARKILLAGTGLAVLAGPLVIGIGHPPPMGAQMRVVTEPTLGQKQTAQPSQSFEVAMLRLEDPHTRVNYNRPDAPNQTHTFPTNRLNMFHTMLKSLIAAAYGVPYNKILGGPAWLDSQHYDLSAKVEGQARLSQKQMQPMLQNLLKERLHLAVHSEHRIVPGFELVIAKGGSKLKANAGAPFGGMNAGFEFRFQNVSAESIAQMVEWAIKQPVVDKTGLTGMYDYDLKFTPENAPVDSPNSHFGSIFSAIQEQLGLKLVRQQLPVNYLVIDHVEKVPTKN
jgi:bla regulator protein BlaR1